MKVKLQTALTADVVLGVWGDGADQQMIVKGADLLEAAVARNENIRANMAMVPCESREHAEALAERLAKEPPPRPVANNLLKEEMVKIKPPSADDDEIYAAFDLAEKVIDLLGDESPSAFAGHLALCIALGNDIADSFDSEAKVRELAQGAAAYVLDRALKSFNARMIADAQAEAKKARLH